MRRDGRRQIRHAMTCRQREKDMQKERETKKLSKRQASKQSEADTVGQAVDMNTS